jgi:hypothetical protein
MHAVYILFYMMCLLAVVPDCADLVRLYVIVPNDQRCDCNLLLQTI